MFVFVIKFKMFLISLTQTQTSLLCHVDDISRTSRTATLPKNDDTKSQSGWIHEYCTVTSAE